MSVCNNKANNILIRENSKLLRIDVKNEGMMRTGKFLYLSTFSNCITLVTEFLVLNHMMVLLLNFSSHIVYIFRLFLIEDSVFLLMFFRNFCLSVSFLFCLYICVCFYCLEQLVCKHRIFHIKEIPASKFCVSDKNTLRRQQNFTHWCLGSPRLIA